MGSSVFCLIIFLFLLLPRTAFTGFFELGSNEESLAQKGSSAVESNQGSCIEPVPVDDDQFREFLAYGKNGMCVFVNGLWELAMIGKETGKLFTPNRQNITNDEVSKKLGKFYQSIYHTHLPSSFQPTVLKFLTLVEAIPSSPDAHLPYTKVSESSPPKLTGASGLAAERPAITGSSVEGPKVNGTKTEFPASHTVGETPTDNGDSSPTQERATYSPLDDPARNIQGGEVLRIIQNRCLQCHDGVRDGGHSESTKFPTYLTDWSQWENLLNSRDKKALDWLEKIYEKIVSTGAMLERADELAKLKGEEVPDEEKRLLKEFIAFQKKRFIDPTTSVEMSHEPEPVSVRTKGFHSYTNPKYEPAYLKLLGGLKTSSKDLQDLFQNFDIIYDKHGVPDAHQAPNEQIVNAPSRGVRPLSGRPPRPVVGWALKPNGDWREPFNNGFGLSEAPSNMGRFFLIKLPKDENGNPRKITWYKDRFSHGVSRDELNTYKWIYPEGTEVAEILYINPPDKKGSFIFEIRTRTKKTDDKQKPYWDPDVYRPYASIESLREAVRSFSNWQNNPDLSKIDDSISKETSSDSVTSQFGRIFTNSDGSRSNRMTGTVTRLPKISHETAKTLFYDKPLESVEGAKPWALSGGPFPSRYHGGAAEVSTQSCSNCHKHTNLPFHALLSSLGGYSQTALYGNLPGSDGVLSFHPWSQQSLDLWGEVDDNRRFRRDLIDGGLFEPLDRKKHSRSLYRATAN